MASKSLAVAIIVVVALIGGYATLSSVSSQSDMRCDGCNVIIIGVDTLRADRVHALGYARETTPTIDALASKGYVFSRAISSSSWTVPSFMSIFTGMYPSAHKVTNKFTTFTAKDQVLSNLHQLSPEVKTLAEEFKAAGYATGGFTGDAGVSGRFGYSQGFDIYTDETTFGGMDNSALHALAWLDSIGSEKFFMFFHGYDLHGQFKEPAGYKGVFVPDDYEGPYDGSGAQEAKLREDQLLPSGITLTGDDVEFWNGFYDSKIRDADVRLASFLDELEKRHLLDNTIIVLVSDHGEEFYEHKGFDHGHSLYDELVHVPLIFVLPHSTRSRVIDTQVSTMDIAPTLLGIVGITPDPAFASQSSHAVSLAPLLTGATKQGQDVFLETDYRNFTHKRGLRSADGWKYIRTLESADEELYDLSRDPSEQHNLIDQDTEKASQLRGMLDRHMKDDLKEDPQGKWTVGCLPVYDGECK